MTEKLVRSSVVLAMTSGTSLDLVGRDGSLRRLDGDTAALAEALLSFCVTPRAREEIVAHVEELTGAPLEAGARVVDELVTLLRESGALTTSATRKSATTSARVVIGMGGAVAAAHAPMLVQSLQALGIEVRVIASERALRFVSREALEALTHAPVLSAMWSEETARVPHIELAAWADLVVIWPATATMIGRIATGDCSELVSAVAITTRAPVLVAPSMNEAMLDAASVARNLETLRADGFRIAASALAYEVADAPDRRVPARGGAPDAASLTKMIDALCRANVPEPRDAASWETFHRRVPESEQAWVTADADPIVTTAIDAHARGGTLWDIGTGHGAIAIAAAARGFHVIATDVSATALSRARARAGAARIVWLEGDVTASHWHGEMDVIVDRGTLHTLEIERRAAYAHEVVAHTRAGTIVIITTHTGDPRVRSHPMTSHDVEALLGDGFEVIDRIEGTFAGSIVPAPACVTTILRRRWSSLVDGHHDGDDARHRGIVHRQRLVR